MMRLLIFTLVIGFLFTGSLSVVHADTLTLRNNAEMNGKVAYDDDDFVIIARYSGSSVTKTLSRADVRSVEINQRDFNPGEPPKEVSVFDRSSPSGQNASNKQNSQTQQSSANSSSGHSGHVKHDIFDTNDLNPSVRDVVWLRTKSSLSGRLISIRDGKLAMQIGKSVKKVDLVDIVRILVAPD